MSVVKFHQCTPLVPPLEKGGEETPMQALHCWQYLSFCMWQMIICLILTCMDFVSTYHFNINALTTICITLPGACYALIWLFFLFLGHPSLRGYTLRSMPHRIVTSCCAYTGLSYATAVFSPNQIQLHWGENLLFSNPVSMIYHTNFALLTNLNLTFHICSQPPLLVD